MTKIYADAVVNLMNDIRDSIEEQFDSIDKQQTHFLNKILININQIQLDSTIESENPYRVSTFFN